MNISKEPIVKMNTTKLRELGEESDYIEIVDSERRKQYKIQTQKANQLLTTNKIALLDLKSVFEGSYYLAYFQMDLPSLNLEIRSTSMSGGYPGLIATIDFQSKIFMAHLDSYIPIAKVKKWCAKYQFSLMKDYTYDLDLDIDFLHIYLYGNP